MPPISTAVGAECAFFDAMTLFVVPFDLSVFAVVVAADDLGRRLVLRAKSIVVVSFYFGWYIHTRDRC